MNYGKYLLEIYIHGKTTYGTIEGTISYWLIKDIPGVADEQLIICPNCKTLNRMTTIIIPCSKCKNMLEHYYDLELFNDTVNGLAVKITKQIEALKMDVTLKLIRNTSTTDVMSNWRKFHEEKETSIYPKERLISDTEASGDLTRRIEAFLKA